MGEPGEKFPADKKVDEEAPMSVSITVRSQLGQNPAEDPKLTREDVWKILGILFAIVGIAASMVNAPVGNSGKYPHDKLTPASFFLIFIAFSICMGCAYLSMVFEPSVSAVKNVIAIVSVFVSIALVLKQFSIYI